ncbi:hypothetical protein J4411_00065 [Candidatus Pacearchaeota archaeon]|nr:hypothetical protein [Candidatus Pacearchaeota archaeon]
MKLKINLSSLEGKADSYFEISNYKNGDIFVEMKGQNEKGEIYVVRGQVPNPINGGGNLEEYVKLSSFLKNCKK